MKKGFTLIEILIVLGIVIGLLGLLVFIIKPGEMFKKNRDFQRINDLKILEVAINTYLSNSNNPDLDGFYAGTGYDENFSSIFISFVDGTVTASIIDGMNKEWRIIQNKPTEQNTLRNIDGTGWLPINFTELKYPPISYLPVDPINNSTYFYSYAFSRRERTFELNAKLEYREYNFGGFQDKTSTDGGSDNEVYEAGTNKCLIIGNKLYGEVSTTTCAPPTSFQFPIGYLPKLQACTNLQKITSGEWKLFDPNGNLIPTDTIAVHDGSISTSLFLSSGYIVHKLPSYYLISYTRLYSDYADTGNKPYIKYYKNATWKLAGGNETRDCNFATTTSFNTTTKAWAVGWGSSVSVCEMEAYGCPIEITWFKPLGLEIIPFDVKFSKENFLDEFYILAGSKKENLNSYPWWAKIDLEGNIISSSTIITNATTSYFKSILPLDENGDGYIDAYLFNGEIKNNGSTTAFILKVSSTTSNSLQIPDVVINKLEKTNDGNYIGVGKENNNGYIVLLSSSTLSIISATTTPYLSNIYDIVPTYDGNFLILAHELPGTPIVIKLSSDINIITSTTMPSCTENAFLIKKNPFSNLYSILGSHGTTSDYYFYTINLNEDLNIFNFRDIGNSVLTDDLCNTALNQFYIFNNQQFITDFEFDENNILVGLGNEAIGGGKYRLFFVKQGYLKYPLYYFDSYGYKIIQGGDFSSYVIIGRESTTYGGFVMRINKSGECENCFVFKKPFDIFSRIFSNIFQSFREFPKLILHNLRFLP